MGYSDCVTQALTAPVSIDTKLQMPLLPRCCVPRPCRVRVRPGGLRDSGCRACQPIGRKRALTGPDGLRLEHLAPGRLHLVRFLGLDIWRPRCAETRRVARFMGMADVQTDSPTNGERM